MTLYSWFDQNNNKHASKVATNNNENKLNSDIWPIAKTRSSLETGKVKPVGTQMVIFEAPATPLLKHKNA